MPHCGVGGAPARVFASPPANAAGADSVNVDAEPRPLCSESNGLLQTTLVSQGICTLPDSVGDPRIVAGEVEQARPDGKADKKSPAQAAFANTPSIRACAAASEAARCSAPMPMPSARMNSMSFTPRNANTWRR